VRYIFVIFFRGFMVFRGCFCLPLVGSSSPLRRYETIFLPVAGPDLSDPSRRKLRDGSWSGLRQKNRRKPTGAHFFWFLFFGRAKKRNPGAGRSACPGVGGGGAPLLGNKMSLLFLRTRQPQPP